VAELVPIPGRRDNWLNARVAEFLRQNPGGTFPRDDRELVAHVREQIKIFAKCFLRDLYDRLGEQVQQESWLKMLQYFAGFEERNGCTFTSWLFIVVRSTKSTVKKAEARQPSAGKQTVAHDDKTFAAEIERALLSQVQVDFTTDFYATKLRDELLAGLGKRESEVMRLSLEGLANNEIARELNIPEGTVSSILCRTRDLCWKRLSPGTRLAERRAKKAKHAAGR
jgi:RNA polymerase sigma factor (sigma-70 family)